MSATERELIAATNLLCEHVSAHIPPGWTVCLTMSHEEGWTELESPDGTVYDSECPPEDDVSVVSDLCQTARELDAKEATAKGGAE